MGNRGVLLPIGTGVGYTLGMDTSAFPLSIGPLTVTIGPLAVSLPEEFMSIVTDILDLQQAQTSKLETIEGKVDMVVLHVQDLVTRITTLQDQVSAGGQVTVADLQAIKDAAMGMEDELTQIESQADTALASQPPAPPEPPPTP